MKQNLIEDTPITKNDMKFFHKAKQVALASDYEKVHVGCVAVYQGSVIGVGCNMDKTHPLQQHYNKMRNSGIKEYLSPKLHAEISCINSIRDMEVNFRKVKLYIYRIRKSQPYGITRPCPACMSAIMDLGIRDIYYTTDTGFVYERLLYKKESQ